MPLLGQLIVEFQADLTNFTEGITAAQATLNDFGSQVDALSTQFTSTLGSAASTGATDIVEAVDSADSAVSSSSASMNSAFSSVVSAFSSAASGVAEFSSGVMESLSEAGASVGEFVTETQNRLAEGYRSFIEYGRGVSETINSFTEMKFAGFAMVQSLVASDAEMEQTQIAFKTLLGSSKAAGDYLHQLWNFAAKTPFQFQNLAAASQQMIAFGFKAKETIPDLTTMGDALSAMGRTDAGSLQQIVGVFGRIQAASKVNAMDMNMLTFLGIPGWKYLAEAMGKTVEQVQKLSKTGKLTSEEAIPALIAGMHKAFGGAMAAQAETFNGLLTTVKDNLIAAWRTASGPLFEQAKAGLKAFGDLAGSDVFQNFAKVIAGVLSGAFSVLGGILNATIIPGFKALQSLFGEFSSVGKDLLPHMDFQPISYAVNELKEAFSALKEALSPIVDGFSMMKSSGNDIQAFFAQSLVGAMSLASNVMDMVARSIRILADIFKQLRPTIQEVVTIIGTTLMGTFNQLRTAIGGNLNGNFETLANVIKQVGTWAQTSLVPALQGLLPQLAQMASALISNVIPIMMSWWNLIKTVASVALPPLVGIIETLVPWVLRLATLIGGALTVAFNIVGPLVTGMVNGLSGMINFFQQNEVAGALLKGTLIALAIPLGLIAIVLLPMLIAEMIGELIGAVAGAIGGFIAWGVAAWGAAAGVIAATWPVLLIIAAIAAVIAITILIVQHWSQIASFFVGVWNAIKNAFAGMADWFGTQFGRARDAIGGAFSNLGSFMHGKATEAKNGFQEAWGNVGQWFQDRGKDIQKTSQDIAQGAVNAGNWMYNHNYYWKFAVDAITADVNGVKKWLGDTWNDIVRGAVVAWTWISQKAKELWGLLIKGIMFVVTPIVAWLGEAWNIVYKRVGDFWDMIGSAIHTALVFIQNVITSVMTSVINWIQQKWAIAHQWITDRWNQLKGLAASAWAAVSGVFSSIWATYISGPLQKFWNMVTGWFTGFGNMAQQSGQNFIQMLVSGIESGAGSIWNAVTGIANTIWKALGFHSPPEDGPLSDSDQYMPNFINMMVQGMNSGVPKIQAASYNVASAMTGIGPVSHSIGTNSSFFAHSAARSASAQSGVANVYVQLDSKLIGEATGQPLINEIRLKTGLLI